jgi:hypothetical protein
MEWMSTMVLKLEPQESTKNPPSWRAKCRSSFMTLPLKQLLEPHAVVRC